MVNPKISLSFQSELCEVRQVVADLLDFFIISIPGLDDGDKFDLRLILSELLCNSVVHGNNSDASKCVHLSVEISGNTVFCSISDEGYGFDYANIAARLEDDDNLDKESGRGMRLVCSLTDSISFSQSGSQIQFRKKVKTHG